MAQIIEGGLVGPTGAQLTQNALSQFSNSMGNVQRLGQQMQDNRQMRWDAVADEYKKKLDSYGGDINLFAQQDPIGYANYMDILYTKGRAARMAGDRADARLSPEGQRVSTGIDILRGDTTLLPSDLRDKFDINNPEASAKNLEDYSSTLQSEMEALLAQNPEENVSDYQDRIDIAQGLLSRYDPATKAFIASEPVDVSGNRKFERVMDKKGWESWGKAAPASAPVLPNSPVSATGPGNAQVSPASQQVAYPSQYTPVQAVYDPAVRPGDIAMPQNPYMAPFNDSLNQYYNPNAMQVQASGQSSVPGMQAYDQATGGQDPHHPTIVGEGEGIINYYAMQQPGVAEMVAKLNDQFPNPAAPLAPESVPIQNGDPQQTGQPVQNVPQRFAGTTAAIMAGVGLLGNLLGGGKEKQEDQKPITVPPAFGNNFQQPQQQPVMAEGSQVPQQLQNLAVAGQHAGYQQMPPMSGPIPAVPNSVASQQMYNDMMAQKNAEDQAMYAQYPNLAQRYPPMAFNQQNLPPVTYPQSYPQTLPMSNYGIANTPLQSSVNANGRGPMLSGQGPTPGQGLGAQLGVCPTPQQQMPVMAPGGDIRMSADTPAPPASAPAGELTAQGFMALPPETQQALFQKYQTNDPNVVIQNLEAMRGDMTPQPSQGFSLRDGVGGLGATVNRNTEIANDPGVRENFNKLTESNYGTADLSGTTWGGAAQTLSDQYDTRFNPTAIPQGEDVTVISADELRNNPDKYEVIPSTSRSLWSTLGPGQVPVRLKDQASPEKQYGYSLVNRDGIEESAPSEQEQEQGTEEENSTPREQALQKRQFDNDAKWLSINDRRFGNTDMGPMSENYANLFFPEGFSYEDLASTTDKSIEARRKRDELNEAKTQWDEKLLLERDKMLSDEKIAQARLNASNQAQSWSKQNPEKWEIYKRNNKLVDDLYNRALTTAKGDPEKALEIMGQQMAQDEALRTAVNNSNFILAQAVGDDTYQAWSLDEGKDPNKLIRSWWSYRAKTDPTFNIDTKESEWKASHPSGTATEVTVPVGGANAQRPGESREDWYARISK